MGCVLHAAGRGVIGLGHTLEAGGPHADFGSPKGANSEEGVATYEKMSELVLASVLAAIA